MSTNDSFVPRGNSPTRAENSRESSLGERSRSSFISRTQNVSSGGRSGTYSSRDYSRDRSYSSTHRDSSMNPPRSRDRDYSSKLEYDKNRGQSPPGRSSSVDKYSSSRNRSLERSVGSSRFSDSNEKRERAMWGSRSVDVFEKLKQIGEGTFGKVYMAKNKETNEIVALKKVLMANEKEGFPITAIREIKILKELHHSNVVQLKEIVTSKDAYENKDKQGIYMVFEYMDHDLTGLMLSEGKNWKPTPAQIKCYMKQLLEGLHYCHINNVLHRDIKGSNLLINNKGELKLADFGLARPFTDQSGQYTNRVITLWYRPPELLLGAVQYGPAIDMWSAGCILTELLAGKPIFPGKNEVDQLELIFKLCGTPNEQNWPDVDKQPWWHIFKPQKQIHRCLAETLRSMNPTIPKEALDLVDRLLTLDPKRRATATEALDNEYFWTPPEPAKASQMPVYPSSHEYEAKRKRQSQQTGSSSGPENNKKQKVPQGNLFPTNQTHPHKYPPSFTSSSSSQGPPSSSSSISKGGDVRGSRSYNNGPNPPGGSSSRSEEPGYGRNQPPSNYRQAPSSTMSSGRYSSSSSQPPPRP